MDRQRATEQIERIVCAIENERFPARVKEFYVFGSYARGALRPNDLDVILLHEPAAGLLERHKADIEAKHGNNIMYWPGGASPERRFESSMRAVARKPGEKMDILLATSMDKINDMGENIARSHRVLIWSQSDHDWQSKLHAIQPDPNAGRHERAHFADLKQFKAELRTMINITEAISQGFLKLTRIDADAVEPALNPTYQHWYDWWVDCKVMGKQSMKLLRHGMWWLQEQNDQRAHRPHPPRQGATMCSGDGKFAVYFGQPPLHPAYDVCYGDRQRIRICLIPHFKKGQSHEMFVFEKGDKIDQKELERIMNTA